MEQFCNKINANDTITEDLKVWKERFTTIQVGSCFLGVVGNGFNIQTLQSPTLQSVPFMYIRSLAYFDLIALTMILCHFILVRFPNITPIMFYTTYIEAPIINTFLIAGLYCAFFLTLERYFMITKYQQMNLTNTPDHKKRARGKIFMMLSLSFLIHLPMVLQRTLQLNENEEYAMVNNVELLCKEPHWSIYSYYKLSRECLRFLIVILMTILNVIIAIQLQDHKKRRDRLGRRSSPQNDSPNGISADSESTVNSLMTFRREDTMLIKSFTEKKLTVLMIVICIIFLLGNIPQIIVMILQNESMENNYKFQIYRHCSNTLEVLNHCLNFYVFCMASTEYTKAFLLNYKCLQNFLYRFPKMARFLSSRRSSSVMVSSGGFGMANKEYLSMDSIPEEARQWVIDPSSSPYAQADSNIKGILVTGNRETRQKKSLTIVNHCAMEIEIDSDHEVTSI